MTKKDKETEKDLITKKLIDAMSKAKKKTSDKASDLGELVADSTVGEIAKTTKDISYETFEKTSTKAGDLSQKIVLQTRTEDGGRKKRFALRSG